MKTLSVVQAAMIASLYVALTLIAAGFDLASGAVQVRFSECLTVLPYYTPAAIPGLIVGCLLAVLLYFSHQRHLSAFKRQNDKAG